MSVNEAIWVLEYQAKLQALSFTRQLMIISAAMMPHSHKQGTKATSIGSWGWKKKGNKNTYLQLILKVSA